MLHESMVEEIQFPPQKWYSVYKDRGPSAVEHFLRGLQEEEQEIKEVLANPKAMVMTPEHCRAYKKDTNCHVYKKPLDGNSIRDQCHITGKYRRTAHNACNLKLRLNSKTTTIPVVFHNLRGYDSHLLMQAISKVEGKLHAFLTTWRNTISSPLVSSASLTVFNSCWPRLIS